ncbi:MAG: type I restriction endonuclease subunit R [Rectinemataceae bacterium]
MTSESQIEQAFITKLQELKYTYRQDIRDLAALKQNFREKFEALNHVKLLDSEFARLMDEIIGADVFAAAMILRERNTFEREDGTPLHFTLVNIKDWCKNSFEVVNQLRINTENSHQRYDVMLLINGVPIAQIELKTLAISPRRAMQQIVDYKNEPGSGYSRTLLCFVQLFIISNRSDTWYFANNNASHFSFDADERFLPLYQFADEANKKITHLDDFAEKFLAKCTLGAMVSRYMVLVASEQKLLMMRPYQIYAVRAIVDCIHQNRGNGNIWHTTGSGKTLTSFKASTLLKDNPDVEKCLFVVDRKDLDRQTREEFNKFQEGCVEENTNTEAMVRRLLSDDYADKVIVTTIQKLGLALDGSNKRNYKERLEPLRNKRMVFIFDECHRSQFGENHQAIKEFFPNSQLFGFTGTPIFEKNATHQQNRRSRSHTDHHRRRATRMSSKFRKIFPRSGRTTRMHRTKRRPPKAIITDYNTSYKTNYDINNFDLYYQDIQKRIKDQQYPNQDYGHGEKIDLVIVVDMLLTGFDSKYLNTLYVDKNLKYHGLIQAFSRTDRILNDTKPYGTILDFRQQQEAVNEAIALFSGEKTDRAKEIWLVDPAPVVIGKLEGAVAALDKFMTSQGLACAPEEVANLKGDDARGQFINLFKEVQRLKTQLDQYTDIGPEDSQKIEAVLPADQLWGFRGVYLETAQRLKAKLSKWGDDNDQTQQLDFEFVLFASALIDYDYIMGLISTYIQATPGKQTMTRDELIGLIAADAKFMDEREDIAAYISSLKSGQGLNEKEIKQGYQNFKTEKNAWHITELAAKHGLEPSSLQAFIDGIIQRLIFDGETLSDLLAPLEMGWKARTQKELDLMSDLTPLLHKLAQGKEISGLAAYER